MKRASRQFTDQDRQAIARAVAEAESRSTAEIVPIVAGESGRYDRAEDLFGVVVSIGAFIIVWLLFQREDPAAGGWDGLPLTVQLPLLVIVLLGGFVVGAITAAQVAFIRRFLTPRRLRQVEVLSRAHQLFSDRRIHHTAAETGVLVYVSLFERQAAILADEAAFEKLGAKQIESLCADLTARLGKDTVPAALKHSIESLGRALAEALPREGERPDENELVDALVTLD